MGSEDAECGTHSTRRGSRNRPFRAVLLQLPQWTKHHPRTNRFLFAGGLAEVLRTDNAAGSDGRRWGVKRQSPDNHADPVQRLVRALTAEEFVDWLIEGHGLNKESAKTVAHNIREQYRWHRLQGRLDHQPAIAALAEVWQMRQSPKFLEPKGGGE